MKREPSSRQRPLLIISAIGLGGAGLAAAAMLIVGDSTLLPALAMTILALSAVGLLCCLLAQRQQPAAAVIETPNQPSLGRFLDGLESLLAGDIDAAVPLPEHCSESERERLEKATASLRQLIHQRRQQHPPRQEQTITAAPVSTTAATAAPTPSNSRGVQSYRKHLNTLSQRLEQLAVQLLASTSASEENRDSTQDQLASLKLQIRKLQDRSRSLGDSIDLLKDLAEQSGVLALNAAIQASRSGEDGLGVIADELQRVANRHSDAGRQFDENLQQLNADLVDTNTIIETGRQHLQRGQHDVSQLRKHISELARTCAGLRTQADADMGSAGEPT